MYAIKRTDQGKGYVTKPGSKKSYTRWLKEARIYDSRESAEKDLCVENEVIARVHGYVAD